jgi:hypothetical protein
MKRHQPAPAKRQPLTEKRIREIIQEELAKLPRLPVILGAAPSDPTSPVMAYYACSFPNVGDIPPPTTTITFTSSSTFDSSRNRKP